MFHMPDNHLHFDMFISGVHPELFIGGEGGDLGAKHNLSNFKTCTINIIS